MGPVIPVLKKLACACGADPKGNCFASKMSLKEAEQPVFEGSPAKIKANGATVLVESGGDTTISVSKVPYLQFATADSTATARKLKLRNGHDHGSQRELADSATTCSSEMPGRNLQLLGPGITVESKNTDRAAVSYVYLCVNKHPTVTPCKEKYPNAGFAQGNVDGTIGDVLTTIEVKIQQEVQYCGNFSTTGTFYPVMSKDGKAAVEEVFVEETARPTGAPTKSPTPAPTYRPTRSAASLVAKVFVAGAVTLLPTAAPTPHPTPAPEVGKVYKTVTKQVVQPVVVVPISFPLSKEEAQDPVMQKSLTDGMADSLGVDKDKVSISCIGDECGTSRRRLADDIAITFKVEAGEDTDTTKLAATIDEAATSGHIVVNVQEQVAANGVLTPSMKSMLLVPAWMLA